MAATTADAAKAQAIGMDEIEFQGQGMGLALRNGSTDTKRRAVRWMLSKFTDDVESCNQFITNILDNDLAPVLIEIMTAHPSLQLQAQTARLICCMTSSSVDVQIRLINCGFVQSIVASMQSSSSDVVSSSLWALYNFSLYADDTSAALLKFNGILEQVVEIAKRVAGVDKRLLTVSMACIGNYISLQPTETQQMMYDLLPQIKIFLDIADDEDAVYSMLLGLHKQWHVMGVNREELVESGIDESLVAILSSNKPRLVDQVLRPITTILSGDDHIIHLMVTKNRIVPILLGLAMYSAEEMTKSCAWQAISNICASMWLIDVYAVATETTIEAMCAELQNHAVDDKFAWKNVLWCVFNLCRRPDLAKLFSANFNVLVDMATNSAHKMTQEGRNSEQNMLYSTMTSMLVASPELEQVVPPRFVRVARGIRRADLAEGGTQMNWIE